MRRKNGQNDHDEEVEVDARTKRSLLRHDKNIDKHTDKHEPRMENDDGEVVIIDLGREDPFVGRDVWDWADDGKLMNL